MSAILRAALRKGEIATAIMVEIDHPTGLVRFWSGVGNLDYAGETFAGCGTLGKIEHVADSIDPEIIEIKFILSGVDEDLIKGLSSSVKGRRGCVYEALLDANWRVLERELLIESELDYQVFSVGADGKTSIALIAHGGMFTLRNRSSAKWSPEEGRRLFPGETGFDEIHITEDQNLNWAA